MRSGNVFQRGGAVATAPIELVGPSMTRARLQITIDAGVGYLTDFSNAAVGVGYIVTPDSPFIVDVETHGDMIHHPWYGSADNAARLFGVLELMEG